MTQRILFLAGLITLCLLSGTGQGEAKELIFNLGYGKIQVIDVSSDELLPDIDIKGWGREALFSADKKFMYVTANRHLIHKVDIQQMKVVNTIDMHYGGWQRFVYGMVLLEDGKTAYVHFMSRKTDKGEAVVGSPTVAQIDLESGKILRSIEVPFGVCALEYAKNSQTIYAVGQDIHLIDVSGKEMKAAGVHPMFDKKMNILPLFTYTTENNGVALLPYWIGEAGGLLSIDTNTGKITETPIKGPMMVYGAMYSPDMKKAYANMDELYVIDLATRAITNTIVVPTGTTFAVMTSADGKKIYLQGGPTITIYDAETLKIVKTLEMSTDGMLLRRLTL
jgi:DNA-binding beta-propeller fold protein YncE